jgi:hypothetical protein
MKRELIETLQIAYALALTEAKTAADTAEGIRTVLLNAHGFEEPVPADQPKVERPGASLDAALDECQRTAARKAKETAAQKPVKAVTAARQADAPALRTCPHCGVRYVAKRKDQTNCLKPDCRKAAQAKAKAEWEAMRAKAPAAPKAAPAAAPAPASRAERIKAAAARVDAMTDAEREAAAQKALEGGSLT